MQQIPAWARRRSTIVAGVAIVCGGLLLVWHFWFRGPVEQPEARDRTLSVVEAAPDTGVAAWGADRATPVQTPVGSIVVYVSGAVRAPDVYALPGDARVKDLVVAAGGLADDADLAGINLADRLSDGQHVHIRAQGEAPAPSDAGAASQGGDPGDAPDTGGPLDINRAGAEALEALPGIGPAAAQRIIEYRAEHGPFASVEELTQVKGIGPALLEKIAPLVTVGP
jgi:competence protein ComEA